MNRLNVLKWKSFFEAKNTDEGIPEMAPAQLPQKGVTHVQFFGRAEGTCEKTLLCTAMDPKRFAASNGVCC